MGKLLQSSQFRLSLIYLGVFGCSVLVLLGFLYWATIGYMGRQTDATIDAEIQGLAEQYRRRGLAGLRNLLSERLQYNTTSVYLLTDANQHVLVGNLGRWPDALSPENEWLNLKLPISGEAGPVIHVARARHFTLRGGFHLLVGRDVHELVALEKLLLRAVTWGLGLTCLLGLAGAGTMSRSVVRRIDSINQTTRRIMAGDLSRRVPTSASNDDFDRLCGNLNAMLDRIQQLMNEVRRVSDNIAHDLRTPLTRLRNKLEVLSDSARPGEPIHLATQTAIVEADALLSTFNALLRIASIESGQRREKFCTVDLAQLLADVVEFYEPLAEEKGLTLTAKFDAATTTGSSTSIAGDPDLLFQAFANVLDNAIKYTPPPGEVEVALLRRDRVLIVDVTDTGPGVPTEHRDEVLQRFYRLDRSRNSPGNGLGLSLVAAVAQLHRAELVLEGNGDGLSVSFSFRFSVDSTSVTGLDSPKPSISS